MSRISTGLLSRRALPFLVATAAFAAMNCSSGGNPSAPSSTVAPPPPATSATPAPPAAPTAAMVQVSVTPDPVPFSGEPILDTGECAGSSNTWFYDTVLKETAGGNGTFTSRIDLFDGKMANNLTGLVIALGPHDTVVLHTRWCSREPTAHQAQSIFGGIDGAGNTVSAQGQIAQLVGAVKQ